MELTIDRELLTPILGMVVGVVERRTTLPILSNILVAVENGLMELTGTDLEVEIRASLPAGGTESGSFTVPARKLLDICRALPANTAIKIRLDGEKIRITAARSRFSLLTLPSQDFPRMDTFALDSSLTLSLDQLKYLLDRTAFAMAHQDVRYYLNGLLLDLSTDQLTAVATDGHRLAKVACEIDAADAGNLRIIVPSKTVNELRRLMAGHDPEVAVRLDISERAMRLSFDSIVVTSKLVDGRYPDYHQVIPIDLAHEAYISREALRLALLRIAVLTTEKYRGVRFYFEKDLLKLQAHNPEQELAEEEVEIGYDGDPVMIGFNVGYLLDVLNTLGDDQLQILFTDGDSSSIWRGANGRDETYVIMPMRL